MAKFRIYVDRFSAGLDELTRRQQKDTCEVLRCLDRIKRFSIFEATDNQVIAKTMDGLQSGGFIEIDNSCGYPWSNVKLTEKGRNMIGRKAVYGLTLRHPWVWAIVRLGKNIENRGWRPSLAIGDWYAIHGGKMPTGDALEACLWQARDIAQRFAPDEWGVPTPTLRDAIMPGIVALARHGGCVTQSDNPWFEGPIGWVISELIVLPEAIPCRGAQGLWRVPEDIAEHLQRVIEEVEGADYCPQT